MERVIKGMAEKLSYKYNDQLEIELSLAGKVFQPTGTTDLLIEAVENEIKSPGSLLDLGCGSGVVGMVLYKLGKIDQKLYASDLSSDAINQLNKNCLDNSVPINAKVGSTFDPWNETKFDYIVDDVSGISEVIADISPWFDKTSCATGEDGTDLIIDVLKRSQSHLNKNGKLFFPILSLSNVDKVICYAEQKFNNVEKLKRKEWVMPQELTDHVATLEALKNKKIIDYEVKFGMLVWYTDIYVAW